MSFLSHDSAKRSHYNKEAEHYDAFNEKSSRQINQVIEKILKKYRVKTVLDLTSGTGSQVFWLAKCGYEVVGLDINLNMLKIARNKARKEKSKIKFIQGDMRSSKIGKFDAVITIFNAVGHLTKLDFKKALKNIYENLNEGGIYIFDIFNLNYLIKDNNITKLTIDWQKVTGNTKARKIQYSTVDKDGVLASYTIDHIQKESKKPKIARSFQTLQIYSASQLKQMLQKSGFRILRQCGVDGLRFIENKSERVLTIAKKQNIQSFDKIML